MSDKIKCPNPKCENGQIWKFSGQFWYDCPDCKGTGFVKNPMPESPPAPTDLLTDELLKGLYSNLEVVFSNKSTPIIGKQRLVKALVETLYRKLQQARPTEQAREKIAEWIWVEVYQNIGMSWGGLKDQPDTLAKNLVESCYFKADQILHLLPDEQAIEKRVRKEIGEWLEKKYHYKLTRIGIPENPPHSQEGEYTVKVNSNEIASLQSGQMPEVGEQPGGKK